MSINHFSTDLEETLSWWAQQHQQQQPIMEPNPNASSSTPNKPPNISNPNSSWPPHHSWLNPYNPAQQPSSMFLPQNPTLNFNLNEEDDEDQDHEQEQRQQQQQQDETQQEQEGSGGGVWSRGIYSSSSSGPHHLSSSNIQLGLGANVTAANVPYQPYCLHAGSIAQNLTTPLGNSKRLRLFGVNLECQLDGSEPSTPDGSSVSSLGPGRPQFYSQSSYSSNSTHGQMIELNQGTKKHADQAELTKLMTVRLGIGYPSPRRCPPDEKSPRIRSVDVTSLDLTSLKTPTPTWKLELEGGATFLISPKVHFRDFYLLHPTLAMIIVDMCMFASSSHLKFISEATSMHFSNYRPVTNVLSKADARHIPYIQGGSHGKHREKNEQIMRFLRLVTAEKCSRYDATMDGEPFREIT
ncbi:hypothetical protein D5086_013504 [Populus alba]|uniref:Uncharacterized protein n=1 Tax=Populus alba TaxID=43335 RepID=A0ACC4C712_POPAL